eukprot:TRINITY_DN4142_c0_g1_i1.p1 TRINITY_DN4142_c0_g1~~TRINITY_DN4142_c0_g1_i1.p1  ORF type:complete len:250 (-),score=71.53 TRINITY_DN4142_c0_g1_i1:163-912(-)
MFFFFFFSSRRRHTRCREVSWARRCVQETVSTQSTWAPEEVKNMEIGIDSFPKLNLDVKFYVKGSEKIYQGDLLTIEITATRKHGDSNLNVDMPNAIHSNYYPYPKQEILWLFVASNEQRRIFEFAKLHRPFSTVRKEYYIFLEHFGRQEYTVYLKLDSYRGMDCKFPIIIDVDKATNKPKEPEVADPDLKEPSMMEQMMGACQQEPGSDDELEDDEQAKPKTVAESPKQKQAQSHLSISIQKLSLIHI